MQQTLVLDGAAGTFLETNGAVLHPTLWSSGLILTPEGSEQIKDMHKAYINAGADVITAVTYQASIPGFMAAGLSDAESSELITKSVLLAKEVAASYKPQRNVIVAAGLGPYGAFLSHGEEYTGDYGSHTSYEDLIKFWLPRVNAVLKANPDVVLFETIPNLIELRVIINELVPLAKAHNVPAWVSLSLNIPPSPSNITLADKTPIEEISRLINSKPDSQPQLLGANCFDVYEAGRTVTALQQVGLPLLLYPNSGETYDGVEKKWHQSTREKLSSESWNPENWSKNGVKVIGGCCRTNPEIIKQIKETLAS